MLLNSWSISLLVCSFASLFLAGGTIPTALRILRFWAPEADTARQIRLENETWLSALLMQYGMVLQLLSLLLLVMAADSFAETLVGAMCATGAFLANRYGIPLLLLKILGVFLYGFWIVLHRLDLSCEFLPLTRIKYWYLLFLLPLLCIDTVLLLLYLGQLQPDIITSCCGVVFGRADGDGANLIGPMPASMLMTLFYGLAGLLFGAAIVMQQRIDQAKFSAGKTAGILFSLLWIIFFCLSLLVITTIISSFIYGMPFHRCPFDILKKEYNYVGYLVYAPLFSATFFGMSAGLTALFTAIPQLQDGLQSFRKTALRLCLVCLPLFLAVVSWFPAVYYFGGGDR